jgi:hypothetical protein
MLGATGGIAYALPDVSNGSASIAAPAFRQVVGPEVKGTASRKESIAKCGTGEAVAGGGYLMAGAFQNRAKPAPKAVPVPTESTPSQAEPGAVVPNAWKVVAIAPSTLSGRWTLRAYALCG